MSGYSKDRLASVVIAPHVSEKAARIANEGNQYVFRVRRDATKPEIRAAVEYMFEVKVDAVHGRSLGRRSDWKKAYVRLVEGQQIELGGSERA
jgi:large subunit ribosomal protein L23